MTTRQFKDVNGAIFYVEGLGAGSIGDPFKTIHVLGDGAGSTITNVTGSADGTTATSNRVPVVSHCKAYNGATWDLIRSGVTAVTSTFTGFLNGLLYGVYNSGGITLTTGQGSPLQLTSSGKLLTDGSGVTQPISAASLPLPSGAATLAKQPALGTAGTASADVISVQGIASMTPLKTISNNGGLTDRSGTVTAGGTAQQLMAANASRNGWSLYNSSTSNLWINDVGGTALVQGSSFMVSPNSLYESPKNGSSVGAISIYGATTGQTFAAREY